MPTDSERKEWVFVTGCARSGTTIAGLLLDQHPDCFIFNESGFVRDFLTAMVSGSPTTMYSFSALERYFDGKQFVSTSTPRLSFYRRKMYEITKRRRENNGQRAERMA